MEVYFTVGDENKKNPLRINKYFKQQKKWLKQDWHKDDKQDHDDDDDDDENNEEKEDNDSYDEDELQQY